MATATLAPAPAPAAAPQADDGLYALSLDQFDRMVEAGILDESVPVYLLHGLLVTKMTKGRVHVCTTHNLIKALEGVVPAGWYVAKEDPVGLADGPLGKASAPEPDGAIVRGVPDDYEKAPDAQALGLVAEVAGTSLAPDRGQLALWAWCNVPTAWIVNLRARTVEVYDGPSGPAAGPDATYGSLRTYHEGEAIAVVLDGVAVGQVAVADILPMRKPAPPGEGAADGA